MITFVLILIFVMNGQLQIERKNYSTMEACTAAGTQRIQELQVKPGFDGGVFANCIQSKEIKV
jgi:hypothetical protein